jgi:hypothetical protein
VGGVGATFPPYVSVSAEIQYATVMRAEDYVFPNGTVGAFPSLFIGLAHMAVIPIANSVMSTLQVTVWHQVEFATQIEIRDAPAGVANTDLLPLFIVASTGMNNVAPVNCPIMVHFIVDPVFVSNLTKGLIYMQIISTNPIQPSGLLRGQFYSRRDVLVAFPSVNPFNGLNYDATAGMALLYIQPSPNQPGYVTVEYWILSRYQSPAVWNANNGFVNFTTAIIFGPIPVTQTTAVTLTVFPAGAALIIAPLPIVFTARMSGNPGGTGPITGPGSSKLVLTLQTSFLETIFSDFIRLAYYQDFAFLNGSITSASTYTKPSKAAATTALTLIVSAILAMF